MKTNLWATSGLKKFDLTDIKKHFGFIKDNISMSSGHIYAINSDERTNENEKIQ